MEYIVYKCEDCKGEYIVLTAEIKRLGVECKTIVCPYCYSKHKHSAGEYDDFLECMRNRAGV